jgi:hypothetical protein
MIINSAVLHTHRKKLLVTGEICVKPRSSGMKCFLKIAKLIWSDTLSYKLYKVLTLNRYLILTIDSLLTRLLNHFKSAIVSHLKHHKRPKNIKLQKKHNL